MTLRDIAALHAGGTRIITPNAYDASFARVPDTAGAEMLLYR